MSIEIWVLITGMLVFAGHLFSAIFKKTNIPDVLPLILIGIVIGIYIEPEDAFGKFGHVFLEALKSAELWASKFQCDSPPQIKSVDENTLYIFKNCNNNKEIRYLRVENGQHNLHRQNPNIFNDVWNFFKRF